MILPTLAASDYLLGLGQIVTIWMILRDDGRAKRKLAAERAVAEAKENAAVAALTKEFASLRKVWEALSAEFRQHLLDDASYHSRTDEILKQLADTSQRQTSIAEDLSRRITNVAMGIAPGPAETLPAAPARRRARA